MVPESLLEPSLTVSTCVVYLWRINIQIRLVIIWLLCIRACIVKFTFEGMEMHEYLTKHEQTEEIFL